MTTTTVRDLLTIDRPYLVPDFIEQCEFLVTDDPNKVGFTVSAFTHRSPTKIGWRVAGGCKNMSQEDRLDMIAYHVNGAEDFEGFVSSGWTRGVKDGVIDVSVTDVPAALAAAFRERVLTLSTVPRVGKFALVDDSRMVMIDDQWGDISCPQPGVHMAVIFQPENSVDAYGWDGDLKGYFKLFKELRKTGGWTFGMTVWNGGDTTVYEVKKALDSGWPVIVINGSGRAADDLSNLRLDGTPLPPLTDGTVVTISERATHNLVVVDRGDYHTLNRAMRSTGLIAA